MVFANNACMSGINCVAGHKNRRHIPRAEWRKLFQYPDLLEKRREQPAQIRGALRIRAMLEVWLFIHIPLTIALIAALTAHVISVFYYW